jgi:hypothetical protein
VNAHRIPMRCQFVCELVMRIHSREIPVRMLFLVQLTLSAQDSDMCLVGLIDCNDVNISWIVGNDIGMYVD